MMANIVVPNNSSKPTSSAALSVLLRSLVFVAAVRGTAAFARAALPIITTTPAANNNNCPRPTHRQGTIIRRQTLMRTHHQSTTTKKMTMTSRLSSNASPEINSSSSSSNNNNDDDDVSVRILCLHGKGGNGHHFLNSALKPLRLLVEKRLAIMAEEQQHYQSSSSSSSTVIMKEGLEESSSSRSNVSVEWEALTAPYELTPGDAAGGYSWWTMPPGVRSYNAQEYSGFDKSEAMVMDKVFSTRTNEDSTEPTLPPSLSSLSCNVDIVLGHSQGAILTAALLSKHDNLKKSAAINSNDSKNNAPSGYILNGVAWPNPYEDALANLSSQRRHPSSQSGGAAELRRHATPILFVMGKRDAVNPIESAMRVHDAYNGDGGGDLFDASVVNHDGGHSMPAGRDEDEIRALEEVVDWIMDVAREKATITRVGK